MYPTIMKRGNHRPTSYRDAWMAKADEAAEAEEKFRNDLLGVEQPDRVFRYIYLINSSSVEKYVSQSRAQADSSFQLSRRAALAGFTLLIASVAIGIFSQLTAHPLEIAYLSAVAGIVTQFLSGVFFWIYNRTLTQINLFYQGVLTQQTEALTALGKASEVAMERRIQEHEA